MASPQRDTSGQEGAERDNGATSATPEEPPAQQEVGGGRVCETASTEGVYLVAEVNFKTVPEQMRILLERFPDDLLTPENLLVALVYLLAGECGFAHETYGEHGEAFMGLYSYQRVKRLASDVSLEWLKSSGSFQERHFRLLHFTEDFTLVTHHIADTLCVTFTPKYFSGFSICLPISRYVPIIHRENILRSFRNLRELSMCAKDKLFLPARDAFMQNMVLLTPYPSLISIPDIVVMEIFRLLPKTAQKNLADSCARMESYFSYR